MSHTSAYIAAMFANTYPSSSRFCAVMTDAGRSTVAATSAGSAVCG
jgi:hypothetical protein